MPVIEIGQGLWGAFPFQKKKRILDLLSFRSLIVSTDDTSVE
jgi:hypothetical protein